MLVIHGPNLRLLGRREPHLYGTTTLDELNAALFEFAATKNISLDVEVTEHEGVIVELLHDMVLNPRGHIGAVLNAGAYAHTSLAIADAVRAIAPLPVVEVHLTNTAARASRPAVVGEAVRARVEGFGPVSYQLAIEGVLTLVSPRTPPSSGV